MCSESANPLMPAAVLHDGLPAARVQASPVSGVRLSDDKTGNCCSAMCPVLQPSSCCTSNMSTAAERMRASTRSGGGSWRQRSRRLSCGERSGMLISESCCLFRDSVGTCAPLGCTQPWRMLQIEPTRYLAKRARIWFFCAGSGFVMPAIE